VLGRISSREVEARIKKIIKADDDIYQCNKQATFLVSVATEMFVQYLAEQGVKALAAERKQRKTVQYKDLGSLVAAHCKATLLTSKANAVTRIDNLEFLADVVPPTTTVKQPRETKAAKSQKKQTGEAGQLTLTGQRVVPVIAQSSQAGASGDEWDLAAADEGESSRSSLQGKDKEVGRTPEDEDEDIEME